MRTSTVLTIGTFDPPHLGHAYLFRRSEQFGPLTVGVNTDEFVEKYRGVFPSLPALIRARAIKELGYAVALNDGPGAALIRTLHPRFLTIGSDWATRDYHQQIGITQDELDELDITLIYVPRRGGLSSTLIKAAGPQ